MIRVFLREKKISKGRKSLYLDFYPPIINPDTSKETRREHLRIFIYDRPRTEAEKMHNRETKTVGENYRAKRQIEVQAGIFGVILNQNKNKSFLDFFKGICDDKRKHNAQGTAETWESAYKKLKKFTDGELLFGAVTVSFCENFMDHLLSDTELARNTAKHYFSKFKSVVTAAFNKKLIPENPVKDIKSIPHEETTPEYLSLEELKLLVSTPFKYEDLKRAALFSALTGLRFSDIEKLLWSEIHYSKEQGYHVRFKQRKTGQNETLPISAEAFTMLGERGEGLIFKDLKYWQCSFLALWTTKAGIDREITFHAFRHSHAVAQLNAGTDIYTLSKLLGHRSLSTTEVYAKVVDSKKREAANRISLK